jgi:hypothetical protein
VGLGQAIQVDLAGRRLHRDALLRGLAQDAAHPGVGVLDVVDRVVRGLGLGEIQVEVHVLLAAAHDVEEAGRVAPTSLRSSRRVTNSPERVDICAFSPPR